MVRTDATMPPFNIIARWSTAEIFLSSKRKQESEDERRANWMTKYRNELARFLMGTIFLVCNFVPQCGDPLCEVIQKYQDYKLYVLFRLPYDYCIPSRKKKEFK